tara:strand:- start:106 stop:435 length:330 start_codon:yes stop_codon:yes gene_type:complete
MNKLVDWLIVQPSMEQELKLEVEERAILVSDDHKETAELCASLWRQNWYKDEVLKNCLGRIGELEGKIVQMELRNSSSCWKRLLKKVFPEKKKVSDSLKLPSELQFFVD